MKTFLHSSLKYKRYAVTGAAGFIGSHLAEELLRQGKYVVLIDNFSSENSWPFPDKYEGNSVWCDADITELSEVAECLANVDVVFHLAASKCSVCREDPKKDLLINALGSYNVFRAAQLRGVRKVIHASTGSVNGGEPKSFYGVSKLAAECYLRAFKEYDPDFNFTAIRYHHVFGPRAGAKGVVAAFINKILNKEPITIFGDGTQQRHFTYVKDLVDFNLRCESEFDGQHVNFANTMPTDLNTLVWHLFELTGYSPLVLNEERRPGDISFFNIKDNEYPRELGTLNHFRESLRQTICHANTNP